MDNLKSVIEDSKSNPWGKLEPLYFEAGGKNEVWKKNPEHDSNRRNQRCGLPSISRLSRDTCRNCPCSPKLLQQRWRMPVDELA